jgi:hypothetical protein
MLRWIPAAVLLFSSVSLADHEYQVTGPVLEVSDTTIVVQKGKEKWELARDDKTKGAAVKVGDQVTVKYTMTATSIDVKAAKK